jgi:hypothetical protein
MTDVILVRRGSALVIGALALLLAFWPGEGRSQPSEDLEAKVKAGFLLNFARYVEWPAGAFASSNSPVIIGVLGQDNLGRNLDMTVEGKTVEAHPVQVKRARRLSELGECHVLFISASEQDRLGRIFPALEHRPMLTVSDMDGFTSEGGMILLKRKSGTMRFEINRETAEKAGLKISSKLLKLADNYR